MYGSDRNEGNLSFKSMLKRPGMLSDGARRSVFRGGAWLASKGRGCRQDRSTRFPVEWSCVDAEV